MDIKQIAGMIDQTLLKPANKKQIQKLCEDAKTYQFASVCVNPCHVKEVAAQLEGSGVKVCTVVGFPLGENITKVKVDETKLAIKQGATEIDMVINQSLAKSGSWSKVQKEIAAIKKVCDGVVLKVILETCNLNDKQIVGACKAAVAAGADYVKTSTGFGKFGATVDAIKLMCETVNPYGVQVKASGGIRGYNDFVAAVEAGATRIGTSCGVEICLESKIESKVRVQ